MLPCAWCHTYVSCHTLSRFRHAFWLRRQLHGSQLAQSTGSIAAFSFRTFKVRLMLSCATRRVLSRRSACIMTRVTATLMHTIVHTTSRVKSRCDCCCKHFCISRRHLSIALSAAWQAHGVLTTHIYVTTYLQADSPPKLR